jgi:hypothetical protein
MNLRCPGYQGEVFGEWGGGRRLNYEGRIMKFGKKGKARAEVAASGGYGSRLSHGRSVGDREP